MTQDELRQAEIEAWSIVLRQSWASFLQAVKALLRLGVKPNLGKYVKDIDSIGS